MTDRRTNLPYKSEETCDAVFASGNKKGEKCTNTASYYEEYESKRHGAYYRIRCGVHSKADSRFNLKKNPKKEEIRTQNIEAHEQTVLKAKKHNIKHNRRGDVIVSKMSFHHAPEVSGYQKIFPNFRHGGRKDGVGMPELSPMKLGPVQHFTPNLSPAVNIENFYQSSKVYSNEVDDDGNPTSDFYKMRRKLFKDDVPHRHKPTRPKSKSVPLYSVFSNEQGKNCG